jgi:hypothetical protein
LDGWVRFALDLDASMSLLGGLLGGQGRPKRIGQPTHLPVITTAGGWRERPPAFYRGSCRGGSRSLAIPDRLGYQRADTFLNVLENPNVGILFIVPKRREVVRMSGTASLVRDSDLLEQMALNGKTPRIAMLVNVREAFFHCGKSMIRSGMWEPDRWASIDGLPSYAQAMKDAGELTNFKDSLESLQSLVERNETQRLY